MRILQCFKREQSKRRVQVIDSKIEECNKIERSDRMGIDSGVSLHQPVLYRVASILLNLCNIMDW